MDGLGVVVKRYRGELYSFCYCDARAAQHQRLLVPQKQPLLQQPRRRRPAGSSWLLMCDVMLCGSKMKYMKRKRKGGNKKMLRKSTQTPQEQPCKEVKKRNKVDLC